MDDDLSSLRRVASVGPQDLETGMSLARALERAGDLEGAWARWGSMARAGYPLAFEAVLRRPTGRIRGAKLARRVLLEGGWRPVMGECLGCDRIVLRSRRGLLALCPRTLATQWRIDEACGPAVSCGPFIARIHAETRQLIITEAASGDELLRRQIPRFQGPGPIQYLGATTDRIIAMTRTGTGLVVTCLDVRTGEAVGEFTTGEDLYLVAALGGLLIFDDCRGSSRAVTARAVDSGDDMWAVESGWWRKDYSAWDAHGVTLGRRPPDSDEEGDDWEEAPQVVQEVNLLTGQLCWSWPEPIAGRAALVGPTAVIAGHRMMWDGMTSPPAGDTFTLTTIQRATGAPLQERCLSAHRELALDMTATEEQIILVLVRPDRAAEPGHWSVRTPRLLGLEVSGSGQELVVDLPFPELPGLQSLRILRWQGGMTLVASGGDASVLESHE